MSQRSNSDKKYCIAFYNLENLFDTVDDAFTNDNDFLPNSAKRWTNKRFDRKVYKLGLAISKLGKDTVGALPAIVGLAEVENKEVINALINSEYLEHVNYSIEHYDSSDERGIDVGLIYNEDVFTVTSSKTYTVYLKDDDGERDYTRDILLVSGKMEEEEVHFIVNHWPSRRDGEVLTNSKRVTAAKHVSDIIAELRQDHDDPQIIVMGDFNDNPDNDSLKHLVNNDGLFNPMETIWSPEKGSQSYDFNWNMFDQILCSINFLSSDNSKLRFFEADVYDEEYLTQFRGKYKGTPFRTYVGKKYKGGYSDHFPVYMILE
ncbi:endonuclease/exonuclease/phosphatase family protein [Ichthyenterobacterium sp. W332]|uniref:Endonuclease/exonuclease/phosphatase family protein n=1 Tax=Microcosmobacter mediterraneus TaxID=3075607 RepID=A0ABU2YJA9_9FLAO|nr:endonuclease/exonuclease/phosphatase family protein [Ichthyenterobacterium sp. W332]MDT0558259.1 endonuclease/exonuclease/phosphatase family protein [Ichthyenterobacterium sp. W332]